MLILEDVAHRGQTARREVAIPQCYLQCTRSHTQGRTSPLLTQPFVRRPDQHARLQHLFVLFYCHLRKCFLQLRLGPVFKRRSDGGDNGV